MTLNRQIAWKLLKSPNVIQYLDADGALEAGQPFRVYAYGPDIDGHASPSFNADANVQECAIELEPAPGHFWDVVPQAERTAAWKADKGPRRRYWVAVEDLAGAQIVPGGEGQLSDLELESGQHDTQMVPQAEPTGNGSFPWFLLLAAPVAVKFGIVAGIGTGLVALVFGAKKAVTGGK